MYHFNSTGVYPNLKNYGGVMRLLYPTPRNIIEKKIRKKKIIFCAVNFSFIYLHISKFLLTFAVVLE